MFWGCVLKEGQPYKVQHALEDGEFPVLHLSNAVLAPNSKKDQGKTSVLISMKATGDSETNKDLKNLVIASLIPETKDQQSLGLYLNVSQNITISVQGKSEVHLSGYFEPNQSAEDGMFGVGGLNDFEGEEEEEEEEEDESIDLSEEDKNDKKKSKIKEVGKIEKKDAKQNKDNDGSNKDKNLDKNLKIAKKNAIKNEIPDDDEDELNEELDEDEEDGEMDIDSINLD